MRVGLEGVQRGPDERARGRGLRPAPGVNLGIHRGPTRALLFHERRVVYRRAKVLEEVADAGERPSRPAGGVARREVPASSHPGVIVARRAFVVASVRGGFVVVSRLERVADGVDHLLPRRGSGWTRGARGWGLLDRDGRRGRREVRADGGPGRGGELGDRDRSSLLGTFPGLAPASPSLLGPGAPRALGVDARRRDVVLLSSPSPRPRISWRKNDIPSFLRGPRRE